MYKYVMSFSAPSTHIRMIKKAWWQWWRLPDFEHVPVTIRYGERLTKWQGERVMKESNTGEYPELMSLIVRLVAKCGIDEITNLQLEESTLSSSQYYKTEHSILREKSDGLLND